MLNQIWQSFLNICDPNITSDISDYTILTLIGITTLLSIVLWMTTWKANKTIQYRR